MWKGIDPGIRMLVRLSAPRNQSRAVVGSVLLLEGRIGGSAFGVRTCAELSVANERNKIQGQRITRPPVLPAAKNTQSSTTEVWTPVRSCQALPESRPTRE